MQEPTDPIPERRGGATSSSKRPSHPGGASSTGGEVRSDGTGFAELIELSQTLRGPQGCPWDQKQSVRTLVPFLVEESFEVLEATERGNAQDLSEELGDLAFVLSIVAVTAEDEGLGSFETLTRRAASKIRRRHPHVFGDADERPATSESGESRKRHPARSKPRADATTSSDVIREWERRKARESRSLEEEDRLPALLRARKLQERAAGVGFDWPRPEPIVDKIREEAIEIEDAMRGGDREAIREEIGDLLFTVVNLARKLEIDAEAALRAGNRKFRRRFDSMMQRLDEEGLDARSIDLDRLETYWERAKRDERADDEPGA